MRTSQGDIDPDAPGLTGWLGGPLGRHARVSKGPWFDPVPWTFGAGLVAWLLTMLRQVRCLTSDPAVLPNAYSALCYSDLTVLYQARPNFWSGAALYSAWAGADPGGQNHALEYPPVTGLFIWVSRWLTSHLGAQVSPDVDAAAKLHAANVFFGVNTVMLFVCFLALLWAHLRMGRNTASLHTDGVHVRAWDALLIAVSPLVMASGLINWDLLAVALTAIALLAWARGRPLVAGLVIGLAASTKFYPLALVAVLLVLCLRSGKMTAFLRFMLGALAAWLVANLPLALTNFDGWSYFFSTNAERGVDLGSIWYVLDLMGLHLGSAVNVAEAILLLLAAAAITALVLRAPRRPRVAQVFLLVLVAFLIVNKVYSPQYVLWLLPIVVLARPVLLDVIVFTASELAYYFAIWGFLDGVMGPGTGPDRLYWLAVIVRIGVQFWLAMRVVDDVLRPWKDPVRLPLVDDPLGGVLDHSPDAAFLLEARAEPVAARRTLDLPPAPVVSTADPGVATEVGTGPVPPPVVLADFLPPSAASTPPEPAAMTGDEVPTSQDAVAPAIPAEAPAAEAPEPQFVAPDEEPAGAPDEADGADVAREEPEVAATQAETGSSEEPAATPDEETEAAPEEETESADNAVEPSEAPTPATEAESESPLVKTGAGLTAEATPVPPTDAVAAPTDEETGVSPAETSAPPAEETSAPSAAEPAAPPADEAGAWDEDSDTGRWLGEAPAIKAGALPPTVASPYAPAPPNLEELTRRLALFGPPPAPPEAESAPGWATDAHTPDITPFEMPSYAAPHVPVAPAPLPRPRASDRHTDTRLPLPPADVATPGWATGSFAAAPTPVTPLPPHVETAPPPPRRREPVPTERPQSHGITTWDQYESMMATIDTVLSGPKLPRLADKEQDRITWADDYEPVPGWKEMQEARAAAEAAAEAERQAALRQAEAEARRQEALRRVEAAAAASAAALAARSAAEEEAAAATRRSERLAHARPTQEDDHVAAPPTPGRRARPARATAAEPAPAGRKRATADAARRSAASRAEAAPEAPAEAIATRPTGGPARPSVATTPARTSPETGGTVPPPEPATRVKPRPKPASLRVAVAPPQAREASTGEEKAHADAIAASVEALMAAEAARTAAVATSRAAASKGPSSRTARTTSTAGAVRAGAKGRTSGRPAPADAAVTPAEPAVPTARRTGGSRSPAAGKPASAADGKGRPEGSPGAATDEPGGGTPA